MKSISITIVEDELLIAESIRIYLMERGHTVCKICISYEEAIDSLLQSSPDLFLLDIRLYGERSGIDIAKYLSKNSSIPYVFLTSQFDETILKQAISTSPFGYLTKPFRKETLWTTVESAFQLATVHKSKERRIQVFDGQVHHKILVNDIVYIKADHVYIELILDNSQVIIARSTLSEFFVELNDSRFIMPHRSYVVNKNFIESWDKTNIYLNQISIPISRNRCKEIADLLR